VSNIEEEEAEEKKIKLSIEQKSTPKIFDIKGKYECFICNDINVGLCLPYICKTRGQNI